MKLMIGFLYACMCMMACVAPDADLTPVADTPVLLDVRATDGPERIHAAAQSASLSACHGYTTCSGGTLLNLSYITVNCGEPYCSTTSCAVSPRAKVKKQPRERYRSYAMPDNTVCLAYEPATHTEIPFTCGCNLSGEEPALGLESREQLPPL